MKIFIDSREQRPLMFRYPYVTKTVRQKLDVGDYGCEFANGFIPAVYFERKSLADLFSTLGKGHARFKREIERARNNNSKLVLLIEAAMEEVRIGPPHTTMSGHSVIRQLMMLQIKYDLDFQFLSRDTIGYYIYEYYCAIGRLIGKKKGNLNESR